MSMKRVPFTLGKKKQDDFDEFDKMYSDIKGGKPNDPPKKEPEAAPKKFNMDKYGIKPFEDVESAGGNPFKPSKPDFSSKGKSKPTTSVAQDQDQFEESMPENAMSKQMGPNLKVRPIPRKDSQDPFEESNARYEQTPNIKGQKGGESSQDVMKESVYSKPAFKNLTKTGPKVSDSDISQASFNESTKPMTKPSQPFGNVKPRDPVRDSRSGLFDDDTASSVSFNPKEQREAEMRKTTSKPFAMPKLTEDKKHEMLENNKRAAELEQKRLAEEKKRREAEIAEAMRKPEKEAPKKPEPKREKTPPKKEAPPAKKKPANDDSDSYGDEKFEEPEEEYDNDFDSDGQEDEDKVPNLNKQPQRVEQEKIETEPAEVEEKPVVVNSKPFSKPFTQVSLKPFQTKPPEIKTPDPKNEIKAPTKEEPKQNIRQEPIKGKQLFDKKKPKEEEEENYVQKADLEIATKKVIVIDNDKDDEPDFSQGMKPIVDEEMRSIQKERCKYLREFLALDFETFDNLLDINPISEYEVYVNKINGGTIKNSNDQTNEDNDTKETQTEDEFQREFSHQWPEDKNQSNFGFRDSALKFLPEERAASTEINENTGRLIEFVNSVYPLIDEMLSYQSKNIVSKDKITNFPMYSDELALPEEISQIFDSVITTCSFDSGASTVFVAFAAKLSSPNTSYNLSIVIQYNNGVPLNYFLSLAEIRSLYISVNFKHALIGGTKDGSLILFDLRDSGLVHSKNSHDILNVIKSKPNGDKIIFRVPNYSTDYLGSEGHNSPVVKIKDVYSPRNLYEIISLDNFGKVIVWNLSELSKYELSQGLFDLGMHTDCKIKVIKTTEFIIDDYYFNDYRQSVLCSDFDLDKQAANIFVCTNKGIAKADKLGTPKPPRTYEDEDSEALTTCISVSASEFFYAGYTDGAFRVYSKDFRNPVFSVAGFTKFPLVDIVVPKYYPITLRNPAKYLEQLLRPVVFDSDGNIFFFELDKDIQPIHTENMIKQKAGGKKFKLLHKWFESNLDLHLVYAVEGNTTIHINFNCSKVLDANHEPIMKKNNNISAIFKVVM